MGMITSLTKEDDPDMNRRILSAILALVLAASMLTGCGGSNASAEAEAAQESTEAAVTATVPADGNPKDVTCKGSYTTESVDGDAVVAKLGDTVLTNGQLQVYYWLEVAAYRQEAHEVAPDFDQPLDTQPCEIDSSVNSWQQYFLQQALNTWHGAQALAVQGDEEGLPTEEAYQPNMENHEKYMTDQPSTSVLYGYNNNYRINTLHQAYLDSLPTVLEELAKANGFADASELAAGIAGATEEDLTAYAQVYNKGYMYFTALSYDLEPTAEEVEAWFAENEKAYADAGITRDSGKYVDIRHVLVVPEAPAEETTANSKATEPTEETVAETVAIADDGTVTCSEALWDACLVTAQEMLKDYKEIVNKNLHSSSKSNPEALFADYAHSHSADADTALDGGLYQHLRKGQLTEELDAWCFDEARQSGDVEIIRTACGYHIVYFCGSTDIWYDAAETDLTAQMQAQKIQDARKKYPAKIDYSAISLGQPESSGTVTAADLLYSDVAHQRYPEVQLYLQQDYPTTVYGNYKITSHGCGITTMAMLATYMADEELTPPTMCARYGSYCYLSGTDGSLFSVAPAEMGFYLRERTYDWRAAKEAMEEGYLVVCVQNKGYWTRGGHYLVLEKLVDGLEGETEKRVQVRDSNIYNYGKLPDHKIDAFKWTTIPPAGKCFWIYENKIVTIPACSRCGSAESAAQTMLTEEYYCEKCEPAMLRRDTYLASIGA